MASRTDSDLDERRRLLDEWVEKRRQIAALEAEAAELLITRIDVHDADVADSPFHRDSIYRSMIAEYSAAGRLPAGSVEFSFSDARCLATSLPAVRASFRGGVISVGHVREIVRAAAVLLEAVRNDRADAAAVGRYEAAVLEAATRETAARTRTIAREIVATLIGDSVLARHRRARAERGVTVKSVDDGLALLTAVLPEWIAVAIADRLTQMAQHVVHSRDEREPVLDPIYIGDESTDHADDDAIFSEDTFTTDPTTTARDPLTDPSSPDIEHVPADTRTLDQIRADVLADLLLTAIPSEAIGTAMECIQGRIHVTVAATTLAGADERLAFLEGHGPLDPQVACELAGRNSGWSRLFLDPTGLVTQTDTYTPTDRMRRYLRARDQRCRFPGCRMPVQRCQLDHNHDHARGGRTSIENLSHFCVRHHSLKHPDVHEAHRWSARQRPDWSVEWHSPLGRVYADAPPRRVMFV